MKVLIFIITKNFQLNRFSFKTKCLSLYLIEIANLCLIETILLGV